MNARDPQYPIHFASSDSGRSQSTEMLEATMQETGVYDRVASTLGQWTKDLPTLYRFPISGSATEGLRKLGFDCNSSSTYEKTIAMRSWMAEQLREADKARTKELAKWILVDWGNTVRKPQLRDKQIEDSINRASEVERNARCVTLEGAASWSKILAFKEPRNYAILDSRVVFSLNWLLWQSGAPNNARMLPPLPGQNSLLDLLNYLPIVMAEQNSDIESSICREAAALEGGEVTKSRLNSRLQKDLFVSKQEAYCYYLGLLHYVAKKILPQDEERLLKAEMLLFSVATTKIAPEVAKVMCAAWRAGAQQRVKHATCG